MNNRKKIFISFALIAGACLSAFFLLKKNDAKKELGMRLYKEHEVQRRQSKIAEWEKEEYTPIKDDSEFAAKLQHAVARGTGTLSEQESKGLYNVLHTTIMAFHSGSYEAYRNFRLPAEGAFDVQSIANTRKFLSQKLKTAPAQLPAGSEDLFKLYVQTCSSNTLYKGYWTSIALQRDLALIEEHVALPKELGNFAYDNKEHLDIMSHRASYSFTRNPRTILSEEGKVKMALLSLMVKLDHPTAPDLPCPIYVRVYWDAKAAKWLPHEFAMGHAAARHYITMAF